MNYLFEEILSGAIDRARNLAFDHAIQMIQVELLRWQIVEDSKPACDALKKAIEAVRSLKHD